MTGATEAVTPEQTPQQRAKLAYDTITAFGWHVSWESRNLIPDDAWPIDIIARAIREAEANALRRAIALVQDRNVHGYISDIGCYGCFDRIENAIRSLLPKEEGK